MVDYSNHLVTLSRFGLHTVGGKHGFKFQNIRLTLKNLFVHG